MTPPTGPSGSTGPPDRQTLRLLEGHLADDPLVRETRFEPGPQDLRVLRAELDTDQYPQFIDHARLDIRWFTSGDFSMQYLERHADETHWECRWDRHPNAHNSRTHFHRPPDGNPVEDLSLPTHPLETYSVVFEALDRRIEQAWSDQ
ncbi:hypothetical protein [Halosimplex salinum]|uniref:hypothetical protein n=1 Tax=Halosimplex salinum TaxID=1710538 RepID=UPI000F4827B0